MSSRSLPFFAHSVLIVFLPLLLCSSAAAEPGAIEQVRAEAREGDFVEIEGRVVAISRSRFFTLQDESGDQIITVIPDYLTREIGVPRREETIRVRGQYDHKTLLDLYASKTSNPRETWGVRVVSVERNLSTSGRNPNPDEVELPELVPPTTPAARSDFVTVAKPTLPEALMLRLSDARRRVLAAQRRLDDANAAQARAEYQKIEGSEMDGLSANQRRAQQEYDQAVAEVPPLVDEARSVGLDSTLIEMYEAGITRPQR